MTTEPSPPTGPKREKARKLLRLWCWFIFVSMILSFVRLRSAESASLLTANPMAGFWWLLFGGYALRKGGVLDHPGGYRKAAWVTGALTGLSVVMVVHGLGLISAWELPSGRAIAIAPLWYQVLRVTLLVLTGWLTILLIRAGREAGDPSPFETWPPCRPDRRRTASITAIIVAAVFINVAVLGLAGVFPGDPPRPGMWVLFGVFYGGATLLAGIQMWSGRWVAITVGVLVPLCMLAAIIFGTVGIAGFIPPGIAIPGGIGAVICMVFLIRGVTCRPAV